MTVSAVHFTPSAHAWHCTASDRPSTSPRAKTRPVRGELVVTIRPGDIVQTPANEWHWHGGAPDHFMTHLSVAGGDASWGEHVTDAEYRGDPTP